MAPQPYMKEWQLPLWEILSSILSPKPKLLTQWSPGFTEDPLNVWAWFNNNSTRLKPYGIQWAAKLFHLSASWTGLQVGVVVLFCGQNSRMNYPLNKPFYIFTDGGCYWWPRCLVCHLKNYRLTLKAVHTLWRQMQLLIVTSRSLV